jgi:hypothetical protein
LQLLLGLDQLVDQRRGGGEAHSSLLPAGSHAYGRRQFADGLKTSPMNVAMCWRCWVKFISPTRLRSGTILCAAAHQLRRAGIERSGLSDVQKRRG